MEKQLNEIVTRARAAIEASPGIPELERLRTEYLGKKGIFVKYMKQLGQLPVAERPRAGWIINDAKKTMQEMFNARYTLLKNKGVSDRIAAEKIDITLPGRGAADGGKHLLTQTLEKIEELFSQMGFQIALGPEIEDDFYNFEALNIPPNHPARAMHDTFYIDGDEDKLLRTHTSSVQIRFMQTHTPPFRFIAPGKVYRCDSDTTHTPMFHQVEGLMLDDNINFRQLKGTLIDFLEHFFEKKLKVRFRPSYFPFTEPSAEVDIMGSNGFLEVLGCGMVHPQVLKNVNIDSEKYTGFAFGMGVERLAMLKHEINDIRAFFENDLRFLQQFN